MRLIKVAEDFSSFPGGRYRSGGDYSAEEFLQEFLVGPLLNGEYITVDMSDVIAYSAAFLDEAFGGLVRYYGMDPQFLEERMKIVSDSGMTHRLIWRYIREAYENKGSESK